MCMSSYLRRVQRTSKATAPMLTPMEYSSPCTSTSSTLLLLSNPSTYMHSSIMRIYTYTDTHTHTLVTRTYLCNTFLYRTHTPHQNLFDEYCTANVCPEINTRQSIKVLRTENHRNLISEIRLNVYTKTRLTSDF